MKHLFVPSLLLLLKLTHCYELDLTLDPLAKDSNRKVLKLRELPGSREVLMFVATSEEGFSKVRHGKLELWDNEFHRCNYVKVFYNNYRPVAAKLGLLAKDTKETDTAGETAQYMLNRTGDTVVEAKGEVLVWKTTPKREFWDFVKRQYDENYAHPEYEKDERFAEGAEGFVALEPTAEDLDKPLSPPPMSKPAPEDEEEGKVDSPKDDKPKDEELKVDSPKDEAPTDAPTDEAPTDAPTDDPTDDTLGEVKKPTEEGDAAVVGNLRKVEPADAQEVPEAVVEDKSSFLTSTLLLPALLVGVYSLY